MIPLLAVPVINRPDLLAAMLRSIDHPVGRLLVIDNSPASEMATTALQAAPECVADITVTEAPWNLGVAASWNLALKAGASEPFVVIASNDVTFAPGDLARLAEAAPGPQVVMLREFGAFSVSPEVVERVGLFDENYHPIYAEDCDYRWRASLVGVPVIDLPSGTVHVDGGSLCYRSDPTYAQANGRTYPANVAYHRAKWGGLPWHEVYRTPFDAGGDVRDWRLDVSRLRTQRW